MPRAIDLFSGCGGLSLGLERAGYRVVLAIDNDPWSLETHRYNFPGPALGLDLADPDRVEGMLQLIRGVPLDLVAAGPPCQPFSRAGRSKIRSLVEAGERDARDHREELWRVFLEVVKQVRPRAALMENVPDMALGDEFGTVRFMASELERSGYEVHMALVDAWRHGVPQHRQRLILVGILDGGSFEWPKESGRVTLRDAIGDLPPLRGTTGCSEMKARAPKTPFQERARRGMGRHGDVVWDHVTRPVREDDRQAFQLMRAGTRYDDLPKRFRRYRDDIFRDKYNRLSWSDLSRSITAHIAKDGYWYIHPSEARTLTVREAARLQTFPDTFRFAGTRSHAFAQIGNAVPPSLAEAIARQVLRAAEGEPVPERERPSRRHREIRRSLLAWATADQQVAPWRHPGSPWAVLVGAMLDPRTESDEEVVSAFLRLMPTPGRVNEERTRAARALCPDRMKRRLAGLTRVAKLVGRGRRAWQERNWEKVGRVRPREVQLVRSIGLEEDGVLATTQALRVVARLAGSRVDRERRLTAGRMAVATIVGSEDTTPAVNAALTALGTVLCRSKAPLCAPCPLNRLCASAG